MPLDPNLISTVSNEVKTWGPVVVPLAKYATDSVRAIVHNFQDRYKHDTTETRELAAANAADATARLAQAVQALVDSRTVTQGEVRVRLEQPDFAKHLQDALLRASETADVLQHEELARLMAARLAAPAESRQSIMLRAAVEQLSGLNSRQIRLLGLIYAVNYVRPDESELEYLGTPGGVGRYIVETVEPALKPFEFLPFDRYDIAHFDEMRLVKIAERRDSIPFRGANSRLLIPVMMPTTSFDPEMLQRSMVRWAIVLSRGDRSARLVGFDSLDLTPVGLIIGLCAYDIAHGQSFWLDDSWDDPSSGVVEGRLA